MIITRRKLLLSASVMPFLSHAASAESPDLVTMYKDPSCGCCGSWLDHVASAGFKTKTIEHADVTQIKEKYGVPSNLWSCHTATIGDYVIEGHVPVAAIKKMMAEKLPIKGLAAPGMPAGSPGMESPGSEPESYEIIAFGPTGERTYMRFVGSTAQ